MIELAKNICVTNWYGLITAVSALIVNQLWQIVLTNEMHLSYMSNVYYQCRIIDKGFNVQNTFIILTDIAIVSLHMFG